VVRLWLKTNGRTVPLSQISFDRIVLRDGEPVPLGPAEVAMSVDGREQRWQVEVGTSVPGSRTVPIRLLGPIEA
jgi:hypothetical protein